MSKTLLKNIEAIRRYTRKYPELYEAHHFLFDLPLNKHMKRSNFVIMGINPGETDSDYKVAGPTEETSAFDFHDKGGRSSSSKRWLDHVVHFCGTTDVVLTECFFWSSGSVKGFENKFGPLHKWPHLDFCKEQNLDLLEHYRPRAVLFPGLSWTGVVSALYGLVHEESKRAANGHRLIERYRDRHRPWIFTKHWSGSRGFSKPQRATIRQYISDL